MHASIYAYLQECMCVVVVASTCSTLQNDSIHIWCCTLLYGARERKRKKNNDMCEHFCMHMSSGYGCVCTFVLYVLLVWFDEKRIFMLSFSATNKNSWCPGREPS